MTTQLANGKNSSQTNWTITNQSKGLDELIRLEDIIDNTDPVRWYHVMAQCNKDRIDSVVAAAERSTMGLLLTDSTLSFRKSAKYLNPIPVAPLFVSHRHCMSFKFARYWKSMSFNLAFSIKTERSRGK